MRLARIGGAMVVLALAGGVAYAGRQTPTPPHSPVETASVTVTTSVVGAATTSTALPAPTSVDTAPEEWGFESVLHEGMSAWGRFAVSGDLETVEPWFSTRGPQWRQFEQEAPALAEQPLGEPPYSVVVEVGEMSGEDSLRRVEARVTWVRTGEPSQTYDWVVVMRRTQGDWRIWTVEEL